MGKNWRRALHFEASRVTSLGMFRYSLEYFAASIVTDDALGEEEGYEIIAPIPVMFLMARSMELALKAFLLERGVAHDEIIQKVGHCLIKALDLAEKHGLCDNGEFSKEDREFVAMVSELYSNKEYEYPATGAKTFPVFGPLQEMGALILTAAAGKIPFAPDLIKRSKAGGILSRCIELPDSLFESS